MHRPVTTAARLRPVLGGCAFALALVSVTAACNPSTPGGSRRDGGFLPDRGGPSDPPPTPVLDPHPTPVPWPVATLRGAATDATRIVVEGAGNPLVKRVGTDSTFCIDVPMVEAGQHDFQVRSQNDDGLFSGDVARLTVTFDPSAPPVNGQTTCNGAAPGPCPRETEICDNNRDDNCNGLVDVADPDCSACENDLFEPNDDVTGPRIEPIRHDNLRICEGDSDYYGVVANEGADIDVRLFFNQADGDLDLALLDTDWSSIVERSDTQTDDEQILHTARRTGEYKIHVYSRNGDEVSYSLDIRVSGP